MLASRAGISPVMVGRAAELTTLERLLDASAGPQVALITGEAGVGKSRLVREFLARSSAVVLAGQATEGDLGHPFEAFRDALEQTVVGWSDLPLELAAWGHPIRHLLGPQLPPVPHTDDHEHALDELLRASVELVRFLAGGQRVIVVFEDLHWADAESVALFDRLAGVPELPLLLVGTFRPEDFDRRHPLAGLLPDLERQRAVTHLPLRRLTPSDLASMLEAVFAAHVSRQTVEALHRRTQGNPFFVEELIAGAACASPDDLVEAPLPWNVAEAVLRRLDHLPAVDRKVLEAAGVLGQRVDFDLLSAVTTLDEEALIGVLERLIERGLLSEHETDVFAFRHALTREAISGELLGRQRRRLHERAYDALLAAGATDPALLAHHAAEAGRPGDAAEHARRAATRALLEGSTSQALRLAELGLDQAEDDLELTAVAARASWAAGMLVQAERYGEQWRELAVESGEDAEESAALRHLANCRWTHGDRDGYWRRVEEALAVSERLGPSEERAWALAYCAQAHLLTGDGREAIAWADRTIAMVEAVGADVVRAHALVTKGTALAEDRAHVDEGVRLLQRGREEATARGALITLSRALNNALLPIVDEAAFADAWKLLDEGMAIADRYGMDMFAAKLSVLAVQVAYAEGDGGRADEEIAKARRRVTGMAVSEVELAALEVFGLVERGDLEAAAGVVAAAAPAVSRTAPCTERSSFNAMVLALAAAGGDAGALEHAVAEYVAGREAVPGASVVDLEVGLRLLEAGYPADRVRAVARLEPGVKPQARTAAWAAQLTAGLDQVEGRLDAAVDGFRAALAAPTQWRPAAYRADAHGRLADCLAALGRDGAVAQAEEAIALLERWPSGRLDSARALLRRLGGGGQEPGGLLTAREREVVALLARGYTNRQIADRLYIAPKTAAVHVSNILAKTGLSTRTEVAAWSLREGLADPAR